MIQQKECEISISLESSEAMVTSKCLKTVLELVSYFENGGKRPQDLSLTYVRETMPLS